jgi:hypothetical protein
MKRPKRTADRLTAEEKREIAYLDYAKPRPPLVNAGAAYLRVRNELARNCCESCARALGALVEHELAVQRLKDYVRDHEGGAGA